MSGLDEVNYGKCTDFPEEAKLQHCCYFIDEFGTRARALTLFAARAGATVYLSRKERNRRQHALVGNTASSKTQHTEQIRKQELEPGQMLQDPWPRRFFG